MDTRPVSTADVVIVGGGIEGAAAAWALSQRGVTEVVVAERNTVASGMTGNLNLAIISASTMSVTANKRYGPFTEAASCNRYACNCAALNRRISSIVFGALLRMSRPPMYGAIVVPRELKA